MDRVKNNHKKQRIKKHREQVYLASLDKLMRGENIPEYTHERFKKLKEVS